MAGAVGHVVLTLAFEREGNKWVGTCIELGTSTFSRTLRQTQDDLRKLVVEHLNLLEQHGERESFFKQWGIELQPTKEPAKDIVIRNYWAKAAWQGSFHDYGPFFQAGVFPVPPLLGSSARELAGV